MYMHMTCLTTHSLRPHSLISSRGGTMIDRNYQDESGIENVRDHRPVLNQTFRSLPAETVLER